MELRSFAPDRYKVKDEYYGKGKADTAGILPD